MTAVARIRRAEDPTDLMSKMEALQDAVASVQQTFEVQFGLELEPHGMPGAPDANPVLYGSTIALTNEAIQFEFACAFDGDTASSLTRTLFAMPDDATPSLEDLGDAMNEIPNVAAGVWKARREKVADEKYQLGLPIFMRGNGWLHYFPRNVNAVAQRMRGPDGVDLQVVLIWHYPELSEEREAMTSSSAAVADGAVASSPIQVLEESVQSVLDTCRIQMGLELTVDPDPSDPREADVAYGSGIALTAVEGGWQLAVMANQDSCRRLTRNMFAMEADEDPEMADIADALGEIVNVAGGVLKSARAEAGQAVQLGLPLFMEGRGCIEFFSRGIQGMAQTVRGADGLEAHVILIWQEG